MSTEKGNLAKSWRLNTNNTNVRLFVEQADHSETGQCRIIRDKICIYPTMFEYAGTSLKKITHPSLPSTAYSP